MPCCSSGCGDCDCRAVVIVAGLPLLLAGAAAYLLFRALAGIDFNLSLSGLVWIPVSIFAAGGTLYGLRLGSTVHGRGEPLAVGVLGMVVTALGIISSTPLALLGVLIVLVAAAWSAVAYRRGRVDD